MIHNSANEDKDKDVKIADQRNQARRPQIHGDRSDEVDVNFEIDDTDMDGGGESGSLISQRRLNFSFVY
ncbi:hypothetical protein LOK49_LG12G02266 [Camellia lanceoleosa]|uniref:Uncharacterized protein n=1 Tax=Camellia lanceoleosa TaxID=1840588 RepID=A0ACC0FPS0_9ERIC|nr:hypothetical protein LOK49_LG12G02266 [Camellia lanceoleosa]